MSDKVLNQIHGSKKSALQKYRELHVGSAGLLFFIKYELLTFLFGSLPGALGLVCRSLFYPSLFKEIGRGVVFGRNMTIRNPKAISIGDRVVFDEACVLDAKGKEDPGLSIGSNVFISRHVILGCKGGKIDFGNELTIGPNCTFHAVDDSHIRIGDYSIIAGHCYFAGGANYGTERTDIPIVKQAWHKGVGIRIGSDVWLGGGVMVLDGACVGDSSIIGAQSLLKGTMPARSIAYGAPAVVKAERSSDKTTIAGSSL